MPEIGFLIFWIIFLFFSEFSCLGRVWTEFGTKIFSPFLGLSHLVLAINNARKRFFWFFKFFSEFSFPGREWTEFGTKIMPERGFLIFWFFFPFLFRNFLARAKCEQNSGLKFFYLFLGLSHPVLARNNKGKRFFHLLNFFAIFFGIFLLELSMSDM